METKLGLNPSLYKVHKFDYIKSIGPAYLSIFDLPVDFDTLVTAHILYSYYFDIEYFGKGILPDQLQVYLRDEITKIYLHSWCDKIGSYETSHKSIQQVPYGYTAG